VYIRAWVYVDSQTSPNADLLQLGTDGWTNYWVAYRSGGALHIYNGVEDTDAGSGGSFTLDAWHLIEMRVTTGTTQAWFDGTQVVNATSEDNGTDPIVNAAIGDVDGRTFTAYVDDVVVDNVPTGAGSSLNVDDSLHVGGTATFGNSLLINVGDEDKAQINLMETNDRGFNLFYDGNPNEFVLQANDGGSLANVMTVQRTNGAFLFQSSDDTGNTNAFQVQNNAGGTLFNINAEDGGVAIGSDNDFNDGRGILRLYNEANTNGFGTKILFGDGNITSSQNVWIGEHGATDSDQLQLHGASGVFITGEYDGSVEIANFFSDVDPLDGYGTGAEALAVAQFNSRAVFGYDGSTHDALIAGNSGKGIRLYTDGHDSTTYSTLSLDTDGAALFRNYTDTTSAFKIQGTSDQSLFTVDTTNGQTIIRPPSGTGAGIGKLVINSNWNDGVGDEAQLLFGEGADGGLNAGKLYYTGVNNTIHLGGLNGSGTTTDVLTFDRSGAGVILQSTNTVNINSTGANNITLTPAGTTNTGVVVKPGTNSTAAFQIQNTLGTSNLFIADTTNTRIGMGIAPITTAGSGLLQVGASSSTTAAQGISFGGDTVANLYRSAGSTLKTDGTLNVGVALQTAGTTRIDASGNLPNTGNITFTSGDKTIQMADGTTLNLTDSAGNNLMRAIDVNTNFGLAVDAGAFIDRNSTLQQEFNTSRTTISADAALTQGGGLGDGGGWNGYEGSTTPNCTFSTVNSGTNGYVNINANASATSACLLTLDTLTINTPNKQFTASNLPVFLAKVRPSVQPGANQNFWVGFGGATDGSGSTTPPDPSIAFQTSRSGSTNTWQFGSMNGGGGSANCSGSNTVQANKWALLEIVVRSTTAVDFYYDPDVSDGISMTLCGTRTTSIPTANLAPQVNWNNQNAVAGTLDVDFIRVWQDDQPTISTDQTTVIQSSPLTINTNTLGQGASITQMFPTDDTNIEPGTIVSLDNGSGVFKVKPSEREFDNDLVGVVANDPGLDLNNGSFDGIRVATGGRARVKVTGQSIAVGDYITTSAKPGYGEKASGYGKVLGRALQNFDGQGDGIITVAIEPQMNGSVNNIQQTDINATNIIASTASIVNLNSANAQITNLTVNGTATIATLHITGDSIFDGLLTINSHIITGKNDNQAELNTEVFDAAGVDIDGDKDATCEINGNDTAGTIVLTTGTQDMTAGAVCKAMFLQPFTSEPRTIISAKDKASLQIGGFVSSSNSDFTLNFVNIPDANHTYKFNYWNPQ
jgi:hypothetical protein